MNETSKTKKKFAELEKKIFLGKGIDIGCGDDPIFPEAVPFDKDKGDANKISEFVEDRFDYVFSSHCLEHMMDPYSALREWWKLVKPGGYLYVLVPDEDLYEQGQWPSKYNGDHKYTFTIYKHLSWSPVSVNVIDLVKALDDVEVVKIETQDDYYDYSEDVLSSKADQTLGAALAQICFVLRKTLTHTKKGKIIKNGFIPTLHKYQLYFSIYFPKFLSQIKRFFIRK
jgi:predicted SAM-dependent methyltransferase